MAETGGLPPARPPWDRRLRLAAYTALAWLVAFNCVQAVIWYSHRQQDNDFRLFYAAARMVVAGLSHHLYDRAAQGAAVAAAWPGSLSYPFDNPPPLAWVVVPLTVLPAPAAYWLWSALLVACVFAAARWSSLASGAGFPLLALAGLALLPAYIAVSSGQVAPVIVAALALAWWLLRSDRQVAAGLAMSVLVLKPHIALAVPIALALSGRWKFAGTWLAASGALALVSLASLGRDGTVEYLRMLQAVGTDSYDLRWSLFAQGWAAYQVATALVAAVVLTLVIARRCRGDVGLVIAGAVISSLLLNHHLTPSDFVVLYVPVAVLATRPSPFYAAAGVALWIAAWLSAIVPSATLVCEAGALALLAVGGARGTLPGTALAGAPQGHAGEVAGPDFDG